MVIMPRPSGALLVVGRFVLARAAVTEAAVEPAGVVQPPMNLKVAVGKVARVGHGA